MILKLKHPSCELLLLAAHTTVETPIYHSTVVRLTQEFRD